MDKVYVIRHKVMVEGRSIRSVARELSVSRNTVTRYLGLSEPVRKESVPRPHLVMEKVAARIDEIQSEWAHRVTPKQRLTGSRVHRQLIVDHYQVGITTVRDYLREERRRAAGCHIGPPKGCERAEPCLKERQPTWPLPEAGTMPNCSLREQLTCLIGSDDVQAGPYVNLE